MRLDNLNESSKLYHGDNVGTTFLSPKWMMHEESNNQYGIGIYFTKDIEFAKSYGKKICSIESEGLTLVNASLDIEEVVEKRRAVAFMEFLNDNSSDFWYIIADYGVEVTGPEDVENYHIEQAYEYMYQTEIRNWQIELCQYTNNMNIFVSGWNKLIGIDGLYDSVTGIYCIIDTTIPVTPVNF